MVGRLWRICQGHFSVKAEETTVGAHAGTGEMPVSGDRPDRIAELARRRMELGWGDPLFLADWDRALFLHFRVDAQELQKAVPFALDLWQGKDAIVTLVAFTMRGMRPAVGGSVTRWLSSALATHEFLNARTYVRGADGERGIFFVREWLPNLVARCVGPLTYGLPYRLGRIDYRHRHEVGVMQGEVVARDGDGRLAYRAEFCEHEDDAELRDFLLERYTAFTALGRLRRKFRVWHEPWEALPIEAQIEDDSILGLVPGCRRGRLLAAHYAKGVSDVWMGRPRLA
jgi:uncharacterized protein YqjF (DUF2071 family)